MQKDNTMNYVLIAIGLLLVGGLGYWWYQKNEAEKASGTQDTNTGNASGGGGGGGTKNNTPATNSPSGKNKINTSATNWDSSLKSLKSSFSEDGLLIQAILRYKNVLGKDGKALTLDGKVGPNTQGAILNFWKSEKVDYDDQTLKDLYTAAKVDISTVLSNQKNNIESGTKNKYTA